MKTSDLFCNNHFGNDTMYSLLIALLLTPSALVYAQEKEWTVGQTVSTSSGDIEGHASSLIPTVSEYLGIPYAKAPTGKLRFAAPEAYDGKGKQFVARKFVKILCPCYCVSRG